MKHVHSEIVKAKLDNMELIVFSYCNLDQLWSEDIPSQPGVDFIDSSNTNYFLCLPQHKEVCLHWLNGGEAVSSNTDVRDGEIHAYNGTWSRNHYFMSVVHTMRIKPKKERRWIGVYKNGATTDACLLRKEAENHPMITDFSANDWQFIEIEIEVAG